MNRNRRRNAFTLVEILIVVVILGILAAVVVPQFTNASDEARAANLETQTRSIQSQIELFRQRTGGYPDLVANDWDLLTDPVAAGVVGVPEPLLREEPNHPNPAFAADPTAITAVGGAGPWFYDVATGELTAAAAF